MYEELNEELKKIIKVAIDKLKYPQRNLTVKDVVEDLKMRENKANEIFRRKDFSSVNIGKTKLEVSRKSNDIMYKKGNSLYIEKSNISLIEVIEKYETNIIGDGQYARLKWTEKKIKESKIANMPIQDIKSNEIQEFLNSNSNLSESYIRKLYELLNGEFKKAIKKKIILSNPLEEVIKPKSKQEIQEIRSLTVDEQSKPTI